MVMDFVLPDLIHAFYLALETRENYWIWHDFHFTCTKGSIIISAKYIEKSATNPSNIGRLEN